MLALIMPSLALASVLAKHVEIGAVGACRTLPALPLQPHALGLDPDTVRLGWTVQSPSRGDAQLAYELQVSHAGELAWSSGRVDGNAQQLVVPKALDPGTTYSLRVRAWLSSHPETPSDWGCGDAAYFDTMPAAAVFPGTAAWIGGGGQLRTTASGGLHLPNGTVAKARAFCSGVGAFYLFANGVRVGENVMDPPQTVYSENVLYSSFDVAPMLAPGKSNSFGALLGTYKWGYTVARAREPESVVSVASVASVWSVTPLIMERL